MMMKLSKKAREIWSLQDTSSHSKCLSDKSLKESQKQLSEIPFFEDFFNTCTHYHFTMFDWRYGVDDVYHDLVRTISFNDTTLSTKAIDETSRISDYE